MSTESKHTPGPWTFEEEPTGYSNCYIEYLGCQICTVRGTEDMSCIDEEDEPKFAAECKANAELIASAPQLLEENKRLKELNAELLEALEGLTASIELNIDHEEEFKQAKAIIQKAKSCGQE